MLNVHLRIADAANNLPTPVRVRITTSDGTHFAPLGRSVEFPTGRNEDIGGHVRLGRERWWYIDGTCEVPLPANVPLRVQATKGPEYTPLDETITLGPGQISLRFVIESWCDSLCDGWVSIDNRCHFLSPHAAILEAQAEGIDVVNLLATPYPILALDATTYSTTPNLLAFSGQMPALERAGCRVIVNTLNTHPVLGKAALLHSHRPVFPLTFGGPDETDDWGICDWCDQCHRKKGLVVWVDAFESTGGLAGGEGLVAAILGKIDAIEATTEARKVPLLPWVYRLWNAGVMLPLIGASGKESNRTVLGSMRTYAQAPGGAWIEAIRSGRRYITSGPLLAYQLENGRFLATACSLTYRGKLEIVGDGEVIASANVSLSSDRSHCHAELAIPVPLAGWLAARWIGDGAFAHTAPVAIGAVKRDAASIAPLCELIQQTREWAETHGRYANPKRKQTLLDRCAEAVQKLEN